MDKDGSGSIDFKEISEYSSKYGSEALNEEQLRGIFKDFDTSGDNPCQGRRASSARPERGSHAPSQTRRPKTTNPPTPMFALVLARVPFIRVNQRSSGDLLAPFRPLSVRVIRFGSVRAKSPRRGVADTHNAPQIQMDREGFYPLTPPWDAPPFLTEGLVERGTPRAQRAAMQGHARPCGHARPPPCADVVRPPPHSHTGAGAGFHNARPGFHA